jgi:hypothetical protein
VDIYAATATQDADGAVVYAYPAYPTAKGVRCSVQAGVVEEVSDELQRITQERQYKVMFAMATNIGARDKFIYMDGAGVTHILFARVERDEAGRGAAFVVRAVERV